MLKATVYFLHWATIVQSMDPYVPVLALWTRHVEIAEFGKGHKRHIEWNPILLPSCNQVLKYIVPSRHSGMHCMKNRLNLRLIASISQATDKYNTAEDLLHSLCDFLV